MASALLAEHDSASVVPITSAHNAGARPSSPIRSGKTSEGHGASTAAANRNTGGDAVQLALPLLIKPEGEAASTSVQGEAPSRSAPSRERGRRIGFGVHLARLLSAAFTGLVVLAGAALVLPPGPADLSARLPHVISEAAADLQRAAGLADGGAQVAIRTDAPGAPVEAKRDDAQVAVAPAEPADAILSSRWPEAASDAPGDAGATTVRDAAPISSPEEVRNDAQVTAKDDASIQPVDEVAGATLSEPAMDTESADGGAASAERQTGHEARVALAAPAADPLTTIPDAPVQPPEELVGAAPVASAREARDIGETAMTADRQAGDGADRGAAESKPEPFTTTADAPVRAPEDIVAGTPSVSATDTEGAVEDATTTELQARDVASRGAADPKVDPTETSPTAPSVNEMIRVTGERLNMRDGPSTDAAVVGALDRGTQVRVVDRDGEWVKAEAPDGRSGWLSARFLETLSDAKVAGEDATTAGLRAGEATTGIGAERASEPFATAARATPAGEAVRVTAERLNMRDGPSTGAAVVGAFDRGTQLTVVDRDGQWIRAQAADGRSGWLSAQFLEKLADGAAAASEDPPAREATRLGFAEQAAEPVSSAAAALADLASQVPRRN